MSETVFLRLVSQNDKASALAEATNTIHEGLSSSLTHMVNPFSFRQIPGSPFSYWVSESMRQIFTKFPSFEGEGRMVRQGGVTGDDARYLRSYWEVNPAHLNQGNVAWVPFAKGGRYSPYWRDLSVVVHWDFTRGTFYGYTGLLHRPKYNQATFFAFEPITDKMFCGCWLNRSKHSWAASSSACFVSKSSQWVTSRRKCRHSISIGLSHGL